MEAGLFRNLRVDPVQQGWPSGTSGVSAKRNVSSISLEELRQQLLRGVPMALAQRGISGISGGGAMGLRSLTCPDIGLQSVSR